MKINMCSLKINVCCCKGTPSSHKQNNAISVAIQNVWKRLPASTFRDWFHRAQKELTQLQPNNEGIAGPHPSVLGCPTNVALENDAHPRLIPI